MRSLWVAIALGACYQRPTFTECSIPCTAAESCPSGFGCFAGSCRTSDTVECEPGDAAIEIDAPDPLPGCTIPAFGAFQQFMPNAQAFAGRGSYTTDIDQEVAVADIRRDLDSTEHAVKMGPDGANLSTIVVDDVNPITYHTPRLSPEGLEIFLQRRNGTTGSAQLARYSRRPGGSFSPADDMIVFNLANNPEPLTNSIYPGTPTALSARNPRRMMIEHGSGFWELEESTDTPNRWNFVRATGPANFGNLSVISDPQLSPDGLRLVFVGAVVATGTLVVYGSTRESLSEPFANAAIILDRQVAYPFLAPDCSKLFGIDVGSSNIGVATPQ